MTYEIDTSDLSLDFATDEVEVQATYELLPEGSYPVNLTKVEMKPTKAGNGKRLVVSCKVTDGQHKGRSLMEIFAELPRGDVRLGVVQSLSGAAYGRKANTE